MRSLFLRLLLLTPLGACSSAPVAQIPEPLPEALEWARPSTGGAFLGLKTQENDSGSLDELFFEPGVRVTRVVENSPAAEAGLQVGDIVLSIAGKGIDDPGALESLVDEAGGGASVALEVQRDDTVFDVPVTLRGEGQSAAQVEVLYRVDATRSRAGWVTGRGGAVLVSTAQDAPMARAGVEIGAVVTAVEGNEVHSARALIRELERYENGAEVSLTIEDEAGAREVDVSLQDAPRKVTGFGFPILWSYHADADGEETSFVLIDLWFISLYRYTRYGAEREHRVLRWIRFSSGVGELAE